MKNYPTIRKISGLGKDYIKSIYEDFDHNIPDQENFDEEMLATGMPPEDLKILVRNPGKEIEHTLCARISPRFEARRLKRGFRMLSNHD